MVETWRSSAGPKPSDYAMPEILAVIPAKADDQTRQLGLALDIQGFPINPPSPERCCMATIVCLETPVSFPVLCGLCSLLVRTRVVHV